MPGVLKSNVSSYEFSLEQLRKLIANDLGCAASSIDVTYVIEEVGGDPMDRFRGIDAVTKIRVTQKHDLTNSAHSSD